MTDKAYAVPLHEQLASVPRDARLIIDDANGMGTRFLPVGRMCHEAAEALRPTQPEPEELGEVIPADEDQLKRIAKLVEQEPVAWADKYDLDREGHDFWVSRQQPAKNGAPLYTAPPQREWQGLTDEEIEKLYLGSFDEGQFARAIEAKLKEKNT